MITTAAIMTPVPPLRDCTTVRLSTERAGS
jgi:hypothetical protein